MLSPVAAGIPALPFASPGLAPGLGGNPSGGRAATPLDSLTLSGAAQTALAGAATDAIGSALDAAVNQLETDLTNLFVMLGLSRDTAAQVAHSISGALADGLAAAQDAASQLADSAKGVAGASASTGVAFSLQVTVVTQTVEVVIDRSRGTISVSFTHTSASLSVESAVAQSDPLIFDLDGNGISLSGLESGVDFDLDGNGVPERASWITGGDALLALDRDGNGTIDNGRELFGDQHGAADGFAELARFDDNGDGTIDGRDRVFGSLLLLDSRGTTRTLADAGITAIRLGALTRVDLPLAGGHLVAIGSFERADGGHGTVGEALCDVRV